MKLAFEGLVRIFEQFEASVLVNIFALKVKLYPYKCKENLQSIGIIATKVEKQGQSSTPADIPVDNFNPYNSANGQGLKISTGISAGVDD